MVAPLHKSHNLKIEMRFPSHSYRPLFHPHESCVWTNCGAKCSRHTTLINRCHGAGTVQHRRLPYENMAFAVWLHRSTSWVCIKRVCDGFSWVYNRGLGRRKSRHRWSPHRRVMSGSRSISKTANAWIPDEVGCDSVRWKNKLVMGTHGEHRSQTVGVPLLSSTWIRKIWIQTGINR